MGQVIFTERIVWEAHYGVRAVEISLEGKWVRVVGRDTQMMTPHEKRTKCSFTEVLEWAVKWLHCDAEWI